MGEWGEVCVLSGGVGCGEEVVLGVQDDSEHNSKHLRAHNRRHLQCDSAGNHGGHGWPMNRSMCSS
jgi:hypothetical protein